MKRAYGQALVELTLVMSVFATAMILALPNLYGSLQQRYAAQQILAIHLQQQPLREFSGHEPLQLIDYQNKFALVLSDEYSLNHKHTSEYRFAKAVAPLWGMLSSQNGFSLPLSTLEHVSLSVVDNDAEVNESFPQQNEQRPWLSYLRLADGWAPRSLNELVNRPKALTTTHHLHNLGFHNLQALVSILPFAREFRGDQLQLGFVNVDVVPKGALCSTNGSNCE
ncbi:hypothetical protein [Aliidiomarina sp.]|uniref:hypothetical protein n=1 Tax=Aliidiomarina sp. TaxID=1872439 RepID=UPI003A4D6A4E